MPPVLCMFFPLGSGKWMFYVLAGTRFGDSFDTRIVLSSCMIRLWISGLHGGLCPVDSDGRLSRWGHASHLEGGSVVRAFPAMSRVRCTLPP